MNTSIPMEKLENILNWLQDIATATKFADVIPSIPASIKPHSPRLQMMQGFYGRLWNWCSKLEHHIRSDKAYDSHYSRFYSIACDLRYTPKEVEETTEA